MPKITEEFTSVSNLRGVWRSGTTAPANTGPAGVKAGDAYIDTDQVSFHIYNGTTWMGKVLTTTSTSSTTSTSTTTSTTTTA